MPSDPIEHVVVLMFENHPFDQMLGALKAEMPGLEGISPESPGRNADADGVVYPQIPTASTSVTPDPMHELADVLAQLDGGNAGFVGDYARHYPQASAAQRQQIMSYFPAGALPALHELARNFAVCDHWFSSVPGPTWANRFFAHSGTSVGRVRMMDVAADAFHPDLYLHYTQDTIYDRLNAAGVSWRIYHGDIPQSLVLRHQQSPENASRYSFFGAFHDDASGFADDFPSFVFIEPSYYPPGQDDDHPPHSAARAQQLLADVYNAIRRNQPLWESTLMVVLYDEHGGFYDHVITPSAVRPDDFDRVDYPEDFHFDRLGLRVPALLVSPWVDPGVVSDVFDHTSLLRYVSDKWGLAPLTRRVEAARSFAGAIRSSGSPRADTPASIQGQIAMFGAREATSPSPSEPLNSLQESLVGFSKYLEGQVAEPSGRAARAREVDAAPASRVEAAKARVSEFLGQQKVRAAAGGRTLGGESPRAGRPLD